MVNLQTLTYALFSMLSYLDSDFAALAAMSMQERRSALGKVINRQLFFETFVAAFESGKNSNLLAKAYQMNTLGGHAE